MAKDRNTIIYSVPVGGGDPVEEFPADIINYSYRLNRPGAIEFVLALDHDKTIRDNIEAGVHEIVVVRNKAVVWAGPILTMEENEAARTVTFRGEGLMSYLHRWYVTSDLTYSATDQFTIARGLISHHQDKAGGDFGLDVSAVTTSGVTRDRTYYGFELKNIYEALIELAEVNNGFDLNVHPETRALDLYYPKRGARLEKIFDERNIREFSRAEDATDQASQIQALGAGEGDDSLRTSKQSSSAVAKYLLTQQVYTNKDVKVEATLADHATYELAMHSNPPFQLSFRTRVTDPDLFSYNVGDEVRVKWSSPYDTVNIIRRIIGQDVTWNAGEESVVQYVEAI